MVTEKKKSNPWIYLLILFGVLILILFTPVSSLWSSSNSIDYASAERVDHVDARLKKTTCDLDCSNSLIIDNSICARGNGLYADNAPVTIYECYDLALENFGDCSTECDEEYSSLIDLLDEKNRQ